MLKVDIATFKKKQQKKILFYMHVFVGILFGGFIKASNPVDSSICCNNKKKLQMQQSTILISATSL